MMRKFILFIGGAAPPKMMRKFILFIGGAALGFAIIQSYLEGDWVTMATGMAICSLWGYVILWRDETGGKR